MRSRILLIVSFILLKACAIKIDRGPFEIGISEEELSLKRRYLEKVHQEETMEGRPNVILIIVDDLGKYDISLYSDSGVKTKNIEALATEGVVFNQAYTTSPVCSPSRAGLMSGRYQQRFGFERQPMNRYANNNLEYAFFKYFVNTEPMRLLNPRAEVKKENIENQGIPREEILLPEIMQNAGYATALCGKWHLGFNEPFKPNNRGFDFQYGFYEAFSLYSPLNDENIVNFRHDYFANKHIWRQKRKGSSAIRLNDMEIDEQEYLTFAIAKQSVDYIEKNKDNNFFVVSSFSAPHTPFQVPLEYYNRFPCVQDENKRVYYAMIAALDDAIGMITESLNENGLEENTLLILVSDNGGATYTGATDNGPLKAGKFSQFEGGINIPMIVKWPAMIDGNQEYSKPVILTDVFTTVCSAAGIELPSHLEIDGKNLLEYIKDQDKVPHEYLYWRTDYNKAIRNNDWKLIWNTRDNTNFLYDMREDNFERSNCVEEYPEIVDELKKKYLEWEKDMKAPLWPGVMEFKFDIEGEESWWTI